MISLALDSIAFMKRKVHQEMLLVKDKDQSQEQEVKKTNLVLETIKQNLQWAAKVAQFLEESFKEMAQ